MTHSWDLSETASAAGGCSPALSAVGLSAFEPVLQDELSAWDSLSDAAFMAFEQGLEEVKQC